jgi:hypothetical protein
MTEEKQSEPMAVAKKEKLTAIQTHDGRGLNLASLEDMYRFANYVVASGLAPKGMEKPETVFLALEMGAEVGLAPMQSIQNIAVVNGRATIWGDAVPGLVHGSGKQEWYSQKKIGTPGADNYGYEVSSKRKGNPNPIVTTFTVADAKKAGLWGKGGPWTFYPDRMLLNRARAFNARDNFPDVLKGMYTTEEIQDVAFEVLESKPLEDGEKTDRLADRLTTPVVPPEAEVVDESTGEVKEKPPVAETPRRGRPPKQPETSTEDSILLLQDAMRFHTEAQLAAARKYFSIQKFSVAEFTQEEAKKVLVFFDQQDEKEA